MKKKKQKRDYFVSCIVAAAGESRRMGENVNKLFLEIGGSRYCPYSAGVAEQRVY